MKRFDVVPKIAESPGSVVWGKHVFGKHSSAVVFAALVLACSITVGCSSEKPKPVSATSQIPLTPPHVADPSAAMTEVAKAAPNPTTKRVVKKRPVTVTYNDKTYGVSFDYPRKYAIETGDAANEIIATSPLPVNSVQSGGVALAAVELPESTFPNTDFASAFFGVSVNKALTAEQCGEFSMVSSGSGSATGSETSTATEKKAVVAGDASGQAAAGQATPVPTAPVGAATVPAITVISDVKPAVAPEGSKRMLGDAELHSTETVTGEGARQSDAKYFRSFQNGACYEFALNVTTVAREGAGMRHVDRDRVFDRLEKILATVKIGASDAIAAPAAQTTASMPAAQSAAQTPAQ
jgi:hypothetical protein